MNNVEGDYTAIRFAERLLALLDQGKFTSTYKYAVLLALMDLVLEQTDLSGLSPQVITTRQLADKVVEIYWSHTNPFEGIRVLLQNVGARNSQAEILTAITRYRNATQMGPLVAISTAKINDQEGYYGCNSN